MIVGRGLLASAFAPHYGERSDVVVFASGVSNSGERRAAEFERERALLSEHLSSEAATRLVYFGSCAVGNPHEPRTPYLSHKAAMEALVRASGRGIVLRLPQVAGHSSNPNTLINFLRHHLITGEHFTVWSHAERNLIDIDDIVPIARALIEQHWGEHEVVSIAALRSTPILEIVKAFEEALGVKGHYSIERKGVAFPIDTSVIAPLSHSLGIALGDGYLERIAAKYGVISTPG
ncbi:NAD-dependent epimerase/dehydratase family protein [Lysobacter soli]|uniref:NAD-dependent epimerase/dehydratase family protein n=1 Tax=Lysobacter soli TaxID=453783 RepID=UPI0036A6C85A